ncbi:MlaD family protein [Mycobacteroides chelonae]|uniref:MlaD family protein n=1 Tax=Mycobacteroides chelonae TaxID=1774 RepID=UPI0008A8A77B|nr:MCE family protein [Mycobacteroides chelonae]OHU32937.1 mammalian cell entry protein [Mycobacteroides chelonae]
MPNSIEQDGRGPSEGQLLLRGAAILAMIIVIATGLVLKSTGRLNDYVRIVADLNNVGDGLPQKSDVKYRGVLVGSVDQVIAAAGGHPNYVHINLKPEYAGSVPAAVTARVVPSNVFAVSSVQLVGAGGGPAVKDGSHIAEDTQLPTVLFQSTLSKLRDILAAAGRGREDHTTGILAAVGAATDNRRAKLLTAGAQLHRLLRELNAVVADDTGPSATEALVDAAHGLQTTAPDLMDALHQAVKPMQTFAEKREGLATLISGGIRTTSTTREAFQNHTDQLIDITTNLTPVLGVLADNGHQFTPIFARATGLSGKVFQEVWDPELDTGTMRVNLSFTPTYSYTRADCPRYGELKGTSCFTAPQIQVRPDFPDVLLPQNFHPPKDLATPPGTVIGPNGNLMAVGPPLFDPHPNLTDPNPPVPSWLTPAPPVPGTVNDAMPPVAPAAPAAFGGNVGPVGSRYERAVLSRVTGQPATPSTQLLLGPIARGTKVSVTRPDQPEVPR